MINDINTAEKIFFLGFGFDEDNLKVLNIPDCFNKNQIINSTGYGYIDEEISNIKKIITSKSGLYNFYIDKSDCLLLLRRKLNS